MTVEDRKIQSAFDKGVRDERRGLDYPHNPYMPHSEAAEHQAWVCGFMESDGGPYRIPPRR